MPESVTETPTLSSPIASVLGDRRWAARGVNGLWMGVLNVLNTSVRLLGADWGFQSCGCCCCDVV